MAPAGFDKTSDVPSAKRKLAAILHADVVGYSRMMGEDEAGTHARLMSFRRIFEQAIVRHDGRIVGTAGDAILADFPSVVEALSAAVDVQNALRQQNAAAPAAKPLDFRIGINLGDVLVDGDDIFGDGVNVAARVQSLAKPGGISISGAVYEQVKSKLDLQFRDQGVHRVKNIVDPVRIYSVEVTDAGGDTTVAQRPGRRRWFAAAVIAALIGLAFIGASLLWTRQHADTARQRLEEQNAADVPDPMTQSPGLPTIAVLPFENRGADPDQAYFSDGITEDVIAALGRFSNILVLSWNAVASYRGQSVPLEDLGWDLDVRYVVGGSVERNGDRLRITVQLTDAESGLLLWSERYDEDLEDVFAVRDAIAQQVVGTLAVRLTRVERDRALETPTEDLDAYDHVLRGRDLMRRIQRSTNFAARDHFERAIALDPNYSDAYVGLGYTHLYDFFYGWTEWFDRAVDQAQANAERAIDLDERNASAYALRALILTVRERYDLAEREIAHALEINPNDAQSLGIQGNVFARSGQAARALRPLELALRLDPSSSVWARASLATAYYLLGRYDLAIEFADRHISRLGEEPEFYIIRAAALGQLGELEAAAAAAADLRRISPVFDPRGYAMAFTDPNDRQHILDGLRLAGFE